MSATKLLLAAAVAGAAAAGTVLLVLESDHEPHKATTIALALTAGVSFVASGLIALRRRPANRTGLYLAAVGYLWFLGALSESNDKLVLTLGSVTGSWAFWPFAALVLAFPTGKLVAKTDRIVVRATAAFVLFGPLLIALVDKNPPSDCDKPCRGSAIVVYDSHRLAEVFGAVLTVFGVVLIVTVVVLLVRRWRGATTANRRLLMPVYLSGGAALVVLLVEDLVSEFSNRAGNVLEPMFLVLFGIVPFAFLLGVLRSRLARGSVADLVVSIGEGMRLRDAIADAVGDPSLELAYWLEQRGHFADGEGRRIELPVGDSGRAATIVERDGERVGALVYDESLRNEPEVVESISAAVGLALANERLQAELRAQVDILMTIVDTAPSLLVNLDPEGRIVNLNPETLRASGNEHEHNVRGLFFWEVFIDPGEREAMVARFNAAAPDFPPSEYENSFTNAQGQPVVIAWRSAPLYDESGQVLGIIAGGLDITERKRQEEDIRASRARIVAAADDARRRLERNLHDGAQQRLVSLSLALRLALSKLETDPAATGEIICAASQELAHALEELRELARGIHPAVLTDRGLTAALEGLAARAPLPLELTTLAERLPEPIEAAAYYVVSESIANVVKHARATSAKVCLQTQNGSVVIEVEDDGVGGVDAGAGSGLRGLSDRLAALDGRLRVETPETGGTRIVAVIPLRDPDRAQ